MSFNNEEGRSMVEMLGVLAIIGVLSVGGIAGYTMAMRKYKANEILNTASMLAVLAKSANGGSGASSLTMANAGLSAPFGSVDMTASGADTGVPDITVSSVGDDDVCNAVKAATNAAIYTVTTCN